jgi:hypothetical protein
VLFPSGSPYSFGGGQAAVGLPGNSNDVRAGTLYANVQRQVNFVDMFAWTRGVHQLKFGVDYWRLSPTSGGSTATLLLQVSLGFRIWCLGTWVSSSCKLKPPIP